MPDVEVDFDVPSTMRDGTVLRADVYRPTRGGPWPVLLHRTPYGRRPSTSQLLDVLDAVSRGYIVVQQDTRGRFGSDGEWRPLTYEVSDGYDTVRWAAALPGSSGIVGMFGASYTGNTQWTAAVSGAPELRTIVPQVTWSDPNDGLYFRGGALELGLYGPWTLQTGANHIQKHTADATTAATAMETLVADYDGLAARTYWELPAGHLPAIARNGVPDIGVERALADPAAADACTIAGKHDGIDLPVFNIGGWYDIFLQGTLDNHAAMAQQGKPSRLLVGPWTHSSILGLDGGQVGDLNFGLAAGPQSIELKATLAELQLRWYDHWLKGIDNGVADDAPVKIFVMGANVWRDEQEWPLARAVDTAWHLRTDGQLTREPPNADERPDTYFYDPADPVITRGGTLVMTPHFPAGPYDQQVTEERPDVLVYTTEPLPDDIEVTGRIRMRLHSATSAPSTDWVVRLCDVDTDGVSRNVADGIVRVHVTPDQPGECDVDLWSTSIVFPAGHRIRIHITSSNFPRWDRNLNTGEPPQTATAMKMANQTVFHDAARPSRIILPVVPD
jgi:putative CocE/NonD family hydrolase